MACFVDTSGWYALTHSEEETHARVVSVYSQLLDDATPLVTTTHVLGEFYTFTVARSGHAGHAFWRFLDNCHRSREITIVNLTSSLVDQAWQLLRDRPDKTYSFVDATSFAYMQMNGIDTALTLDHHFAQEGFRVLPDRAHLVHEMKAEYQPAP